ncbi:MAG: hypothetical protein H6747_07295 [Deltaproteobacteria bacterium]|nr:hypothetical protein [Deltaproteobacteria bacterium]
MHRLSARLLALLLLVPLVACSNDTSISPGPDTGTDTGGNGGDVGGQDSTVTDAGGDAGVDVEDTADGGTDASGTDAEADILADADADPTDVEDGDAADGSTDAMVEDTADSKGDTVADTADSGDSSTQPDSGGAVKEITTHNKACSTNGDCLIPCASAATCDNGSCNYTVKAGACLVDSSTTEVTCYGDGMQNKATPCLSCNAKVTTTQLTSVQNLLPIDDEKHGLKVEDLTGGKGKLIWQLSDARSVSGGKSLYFGDPTTKTYANDLHVNASFTTGAMAVPMYDGVTETLSFWLWLDTEESKGYDTLTVEAIEGEKATAIWSSDKIGGTTHKVWQLVHLDVGAWAGKSLAFRFTFDSKDGFVNAFEGAYIDDISLRTGCCGAVSDCNDGNACSVDSCAPTALSKSLPVCSYAPKTECCSSAADCDDGKPCTLDLCSGPGGTCSHNAKPNCCIDEKDCDDGDACTIDHCPKAGSTCQHTDTCCKADSECVSADPCLKGACAGGECAFTSTCCIGDGECDDFNPCTVDACKDGKCAHSPSLLPGCCSPEPWVATFSGSLDSWVSDAPVNDLAWHHAKFPHDEDGKKGDGAALLGIPGKEMAGIIGSNYVTMTSPDITLPPGQDMKFSFKVRFDLSYKTSSQNVTAYIVHQGKQTTLGSVTWATSGKDGWQEYSKDVSALAGETFQIKLRGRVYGFGTGTAGKGIWVDDVKFETSCNPLKCTTNSQCASVASCLSGICTDGACTYTNSCCTADADCDSGNLCVSAKCTSGKCAFTEKKGCCMGQGDCDDGNPCTTDICPGPGKDCSFAPVAGCCLSSSECDDKDKCTDDLCIANKCENKNFCCKTDADCADGETKCTTDSCGSDSVCLHKPTGAAGCCEPLPVFDDFEKGAGSWTFSNSGGATKGWQVNGSSAQSKSPKGTLYYGDPGAGNYNWGKSSGTAKSPSLLIPTGNKSELQLSLYVDTESGSSYDKLFIYVVDGGTKKQIWSKASSGFGTKKWTDWKFDMSAYAGKSVQIEFNFDSVDSVANSGQGIFVDDFKLVVDCGS